MSAIIRWEDPPPVVRGGGARNDTHDWKAILDELRARPNVWAHVANYETTLVAANVAYQLRIASARHSFGDAIGFRATSRTVKGQHRVYACYVGEDYSAFHG